MVGRKKKGDGGAEKTGEKYRAASVYVSPHARIYMRTHNRHISPGNMNM